MNRLELLCEVREELFLAERKAVIEGAINTERIIREYRLKIENRIRLRKKKGCL